MFQLLVGGAAGGLLGAALGHVAVLSAYRWTGDADLWFKGPHGPPFFALLLNTAVFYCAVGAGLASGKARLQSSAWGFGVACLCIGAPMALATRAFVWGEDPNAPETMAWVYLVIAVYACASIMTVWMLGARLSGGILKGWRTGLGALAGNIVGYLAGMGLTRLIPSLRSFLPTGFWPPLGSLIDGFLTGGLIGGGIALSLDFTGRRKSTKR